MSNAEQTFRAFLERQTRIPVEELHTFYDALPALPEAFMLGEWIGGVFNTGHPGEQQLSALKWAGKKFHDRNNVDPIVCDAGNGQRTASDVMGKASLREVTYRGVATATMVYDKHPIFDHFKQITDTLVLGVMDRKGEAFPLYFYLRRP